jgi:hypothetical protein
MNSLGFYIKKEMGHNPVLVKFPQGSSVGEDAILIDNELYALANHKKSKDKFIIYVYKAQKTNDKINWQEVCHFASHNKARSFEYLDGKFYFGLGQDYGEAIANSGDILSYTTK